MAEKDWWELRQAVCNAAPDLDRPPMHWLNSDAGLSYCRKCAMIARGKEFELGRPLVDCDYYERDEWEEAFWGGVDRYPYRQAGHSDITESCYICGITLDYWLTDYGIKEEIDHWEGAEMSGNLSEIAYNLDRMFECSEEDKPAVRAIADRFLAHVASLKAPENVQ